jgi:hypothetical protein
MHDELLTSFAARLPKELAQRRESLGKSFV